MSDEDPRPEQRPRDADFWASTGARAGGLSKRRWAEKPRTNRVQARYSEAEMAEIRELAGRLGRPPGAVVSELALAYARGELDPIPLDWQDVIGTLLRWRIEVQRAGQVLNQVAAHANTLGQFENETGRLLELVERLLTQADEAAHEASERGSHHRRPPRTST